MTLCVFLTANGTQEILKEQNDDDGDNDGDDEQETKEIKKPAMGGERKR